MKQAAPLNYTCMSECPEQELKLKANSQVCKVKKISLMCENVSLKYLSKTVIFGASFYAGILPRN